MSAEFWTPRRISHVLADCSQYLRTLYRNHDIPPSRRCIDPDKLDAASAAALAIGEAQREEGYAKIAVGLRTLSNVGRRIDEARGKTYRLLMKGEEIEEGDEALMDDTISWAPVSSYAVGMEWGPDIFHPMRRERP